MKTLWFVSHGLMFVVSVGFLFGDTVFQVVGATLILFSAASVGWWLKTGEIPMANDPLTG